MRMKKIAIVLTLALGLFLIPMMAHADVSKVSPVNPLGKSVCIIKAYDVEAVIAKGQHLKLDAFIGTGVSGSVTWSSSDDGVATVASNGEVIGMADGMATITAECGGIMDSLQVTVKTPKYVCTKATYSWGSTVGYDYNAFGQKIRSTDEYGTDETDYNIYGLPTERREIDDYDTEHIRYTYDDLMNVTSIKNIFSNDPDDQEIFTYDSFGRLTSYTGDGESSTYDYDKTKSGGIQVTETRWDLDDPSDKETETYTYDKKGFLIKHTDDYVDTYKYDKQGRLIVKKTTSWGGVTEKYTYNKSGLKTKWVSTPYWSDVSRFSKCVETSSYDAQQRQIKSIRKYGSLKKVTVMTYQGNQDLPVREVETWYRKEGKKYNKTSTETNTYVVAPLN